MNRANADGSIVSQILGSAKNNNGQEWIKRTPSRWAVRLIRSCPLCYAGEGDL